MQDGADSASFLGDHQPGWAQGREAKAMPIINEIDEKNPENSRTVDTDTGVYLRYLGGGIFAST